MKHTANAYFMMLRRDYRALLDQLRIVFATWAELLEKPFHEYSLISAETNTMVDYYPLIICKLSISARSEKRKGKTTQMCTQS